MFTDAYEPQIHGVVTSIRSFRNELIKRGHEVYVFAPSEPYHRDRDPYIFRFGSIRFLLQPEMRIAYRIPLDSAKWIASISLNIVHTHTPFFLGFLGAAVARYAGIPLVHTYHTLYPEYVHYLRLPIPITRRIAIIFTRIYCNWCDLIIAPSKGMRERLRDYGIRRPIVVLPSGLDPTPAMEEARWIERNKARMELGLPLEDPILLYVGRLGKEKNIEFLIEAFSLVSKIFPNSWLLIVGDGPARNSLESYAEKLDVRERTIFTGYLKGRKLAEAYRSANLFLFASQTETQGLAPLEAMFFGIPVVAARGMGVSDLLEDGVGGILTSLELEEFVHTIRLLLKEDGLWEKKSEEARAKASEMLVSKRTEQLLSLYESLISRRYHPTLST